MVLPVASGPEINILMLLNPLQVLKSFLIFSILASIPYSEYQSNNLSFFSPSSSPPPCSCSSSPSVSTYISSLGLKNKSINNYCNFVLFSINDLDATIVVNPLPTFLLIDLSMLMALLLSLPPFGLNIVLSMASIYCLCGLVVIILRISLATSITCTVGKWFSPSFITLSSLGSCNHACLN